MFAWLETSAVADWVALSLWAYPALLCCHIAGLAVTVGIFSMRDLRLLGVVSGPEIAGFIPLARLAWGGFAINAVSGVLLFTAQATVLVTSVPFLLKLAGISTGMILALIIQSRLASAAANGDLRGPSRLLAMLSICAWLGTISTGRLIAYF